MAYKKWKIGGYDRSEAAVLFREGMNPLLSVVLASRGMCGTEEIKILSKDGCDALSDPMALQDMETAADRVKKAIEDVEHVAVYGDYDVDGITSSCLMADYLRSKGLVCDIYIPERLEEGYGVNSTALDTIKAGGASLVITVDCGITAVMEVEHAKKIGLDIVITDHHECAGTLPDCPVVDPKREKGECPAKLLAGVGVAFKLLCAVEGAGKTEELLERYGDLVAVGTIADVMPVTGENRVLIKRGLELVKRGNRIGLSELCAAAGMDRKKISVTGVGFTVAPRINAAGRLGSTDTAVGLLLARNRQDAAAYAEKLCGLNRKRQEIEAEMLKSALKMLQERPPEGRPIVLSDDRWHQGVAGIVASRLSERFNLPTVMICLKDGVGHGSCRSTDGFNIFGALEVCRDKLLGFGGHEMAAGLSIREEMIDDFRVDMGEYYEKQPKCDKSCELRVDFEVVKPSILTVENIEALDVLEPYGMGNPQPVLCMSGVDVEDMVPLSEGKHTKMWVGRDGDVFEAVFFGKSIRDLGASVGMKADVAFVPQVNEFRGRRSAQLYLVDFKEHGCGQ